MKTIKKLIFSSISTFSMVFLFLLLILVGRYLGRDEYGIFTTALSIAMIAEILADFGLRDLCLRNVARDLAQTSRYLGNLFTWKIFIAMGVFGVFLGVIYILGYEPQVRLVIYIMVTASLAKSIKYTLRLFLQAHDRFDLDAVIEGVEKVLLLVIGCTALLIWKNLYIFAISFCAIRILGVVAIMLVLNRRVAKVRPRFEFRFSGDLQKQAIPFGLFGVVFAVLSYVDSIMLSRLRDFGEVGLYNAAFRIFEGVTILPTVFFMVMLPRLSKLAVENEEEHRILAVRVVKYMFILAAPITVLGMIYSPILIGIFGKDFPRAALTLRILFTGILFQFPTWMLNTILISINKQKVMLACAVSGLAGNIALNSFAIPRYGYNGAAVATVAAEVIMFTAIFVYLYRYGIRLPILRQFSGPAVISLGLGAGLWFIPVASLVPALLIMAGAMGVYGVLLFPLQIFEADERGQIIDMGKGILAKFK